jgi:hypothetical protein
MRTLASLLIAFFLTSIIIFSCSKSVNPDPITPNPITPDSLAKSCIALALTSAKGTDSQTVGLGVPLTPISYKISKNQSSDTTGLAEVSVSAIGLPPGVKTTYKSGILTISGSAMQDSSSPYVYVIVVSGNVCSVPLTGVITVKDCATIKISTPSEPYYQVVPINTPIAPISYTIGGGGTGAFATGLPNGITGNYSNGKFIISGASQNALDSQYHYFVTTTGGYCNALDSGYIVLTNCPVITLTSAPGTDGQNITTIGQAIVPITYVVTGHYTQITINGILTPGITGVISGNTVTFSGTPGVQATNGQFFGYEFGVGATNSYQYSGCNGASANVRINIYGE